MNLKQQYYANYRWFFILAAFLAPLNAADTLLKGWDHFLAQGFIYPVFLTVIFCLSLLAALTKREWFHAFYAIFFLFYLTAFIAVNLRLLA